MILEDTYKQNGKLYGILFVALCLFAMAFMAFYKPIFDFANYYFGSLFYRQGTFNENIYEAYKFNMNVYGAGLKHVSLNFTPFPPTVVFFFIPFTWMDVHAAKVTFNICCIGLFCFTLFRAFRYFQLPGKYLFLLPFIFLVPLKNNIYFGQAYLLLFVFFLEGYMAFEKKQYILMAIMWVFAAFLKVFPMLLIFYLLVQKKWKASMYFAGVLFLLYAIAYLLTEHSLWKLYLFDICPRVGRGEFQDSYASVLQSFYMLLKKLFSYDVLLNAHPITDNPIISSCIYSAYLGFLIFSIVVFTVCKDIDSFKKFGLWVLFLMLFSVYNSTYSLIILIIPLLALAREKNVNIIITCGIILIFACNIPVHLLSNFPVILQFPRLYLLMLLYGIYFFTSYRIRKPMPILATIAVFTIIPLLTTHASDNTSDYYFKKEEALLIYDYSAGNKLLKISYLNDSGLQKKNLIIQDSIYPSPYLSLRDKQIFYKDKQLTFSSDRKLKPLRLNQDEIIYLSDKNRGIGFYTLRKMKL